MKNAGEVMSALKKKLFDVTSTVQTEIAATRARLGDLRRQLEHTRVAPVPLEEIESRVPAIVTEIGAGWLQKHATEFLCSPYPYEGAGLGDAERRGSVRLPEMTDVWGWTCAAEPERATRVLVGLVRQVPYEAGPPSTERAAIIERLSRELQELGAAEEQAIDEAIAAGVIIAHRPEVTERRERDARQRQLGEEAARDRRARQEALDLAHATRTRVARSEYLAENAVDRNAVPSRHV